MDSNSREQVLLNVRSFVAEESIRDDDLLAAVRERGGSKERDRAARLELLRREWRELCGVPAHSVATSMMEGVAEGAHGLFFLLDKYVTQFPNLNVSYVAFASVAYDGHGGKVSKRTAYFGFPLSNDVSFLLKDKSTIQISGPECSRESVAEFRISVVEVAVPLPRSRSSEAAVLEVVFFVSTQVRVLLGAGGGLSVQVIAFQFEVGQKETPSVSASLTSVEGCGFVSVRMITMHGGRMELAKGSFNLSSLAIVKSLSVPLADDENNLVAFPPPPVDPPLPPRLWPTLAATKAAAASAAALAKSRAKGHQRGPSRWPNPLRT
jgi:hypothetical protein